MRSADVKLQVRARDSYRCTDCGMSNDEHVLTYGRVLDVHRVIPGCVYHSDLCVTLCRPCHQTKPKTPGPVLVDPIAYGIAPEQLALYEPAPKSPGVVFRVPGSSRQLVDDMRAASGLTITAIVRRALDKLAAELGLRA